MSAPVQADEAIRVERLAHAGFRNLHAAELRPGSHFNVISGENGSGKSNLLEAIAYLALLRSFRGARKEDLIAQEAAALRLDASLGTPLLPHRVEVLLPRHEARVVRVDGKRPASLGAHYANVQLVLFQPADVDLMSGPPEGRRAFLDRILEQLDPQYCRLRAEYDKALRSRNRLLKAERVDRRAVQSYDALLSQHGARIGRARLALSEELAPLCEAWFAEITEQALPLELRYVARHEPDVEALARAFGDSFVKDVARGFTGVGPHGDDLKASARGTLLKHFASQGQHRALVLALRVAEVSALSAHTRKLPILLLDDVSSELDRARNRRFFQLLGRLGGQVFLTTTHPEFILLDHDRSDFRVEGGVLTCG